MTRELLLEYICPGYRAPNCFKGDISFNCSDCNRVLNEMLDKYDKQIRADAIDELKNKIVYHLNDYALQEAPIYQDEDDVANQRPVYLAIKNCINGVIEIAEQLKEQDK